MIMKITYPSVGRANPTAEKQSRSRTLINNIQYHHRVSSDNIHCYPPQSGWRFLFTCVLGAFMFLSIAAKI